MKTVVIAYGNTYAVKSRLSALGFRWLAGDKCWVRFDREGDDSATLERVLQGLRIRFGTVMADPFIGTTVDPLVSDYRTARTSSGYDWRRAIESVNHAPTLPELKIIERPTFAPGATIVVKNWIAKRLQKERGLEYFYRHLEVIETHRETSKAIQVTIRFSPRIGVCCSICGRALDTAISRATGIGPVCAERMGITRYSHEDAREVIAQKAELIGKIGEMGPVWIPRSQIRGLLETQTAADALAADDDEKPTYIE